MITVSFDEYMMFLIRRFRLWTITAFSHSGNSGNLNQTALQRAEYNPNSKTAGKLALQR